MNHCIKLFLGVFLFAGCFVMQAQTKKDLEKKKSQLQKEISNTNKLLNETKKSKRLSLGKLVALNNKIKAREELIKTIGSEINILGEQIGENQKRIDYLQQELERLKKEYAGVIYFAYKNKSAYNKLMFIFSANDFNQAYKRLKYFQQYSDYRKQQAALIDSTQRAIQRKNSDLKVKKEDKNKLLLNEEDEKKELTLEKKEKEGVLSQLQSKEKQLKKELAKKQEDANRLNAAIKKIIEDEIRKAREEARKNRKKEDSESTSAGKGTTEKANKTEEIKMTPEAQKLSNSFTANKSKLPWPVAEGVITGTFGEHDHPVLKGIKVKNNGIDISTRNGAAIRAVFEGTVSGVINIPGAGKAVILRHGEYLTVYSNLASVNVSKGDKVKTKQSLGSVLTDDELRSELHFEIWKGSILLNPSQWIYAN